MRNFVAVIVRKSSSLASNLGVVLLTLVLLIAPAQAQVDIGALRKKADQGDLSAQVDLGVRLLMGNGVIANLHRQ